MRHYAQLATSIWRPGDEFSQLSVTAQWVYIMLISQPDISAAGVLPLALKRWSARAKDCSPELIMGALRELAEHRFVVFDENTEEVLVRTFVKWDNGYRNSKRRPVILRAAEQVESLVLRRVLAGELARLGLRVDGLDTSDDGASDALSDGSPPGLHVPRGDAPGGQACETRERLFPQVDRLSDALSDGPCDAPADGTSRFDGVGLGQHLSIPNPQPSTLNPQPLLPAFGGQDTPSSQKQDLIHSGSIVAAYVGAAQKAGRTVPTGFRGQLGRSAKRLLEKDQVDPQMLLEVAQLAGAEGWVSLERALMVYQRQQQNRQGRRSGALGIHNQSGKVQGTHEVDPARYQAPL